MGKRLTQEEFIRRAREVHGDKYDYSKVEYVNKDTKVCIICKTHGEFWQTPHNHITNKQNCPKCSFEQRNGTTKSFVNKAKSVHGNKYDYSKVKYVDSKTKVCIICPEHGVFWQRPDIHLSGSLCPKCSNENRFNTLDYYIQMSKEKFGDKYDFSNSIYLGARNKIEVKCKDCGYIFSTTPLHLIRNNGCKMCKIEEDRRIFCIDGEVWKDINGFNGYQVSNKGRVRSIDRFVNVGNHTKEVSGIILKLTTDKDGYKTVSFKVGEGNKSFHKRVHRLVAEAFIPKVIGKDVIDHINGIVDDNRVENLRWCTVKENANFELAKTHRSEAIKQSYVNNPKLRELRATTFGKSCRKRVEIFRYGVSIGLFDSQVEASLTLGVSQSIISSLMRSGKENKNGISVKNI